jgi:hypothetical protein
MLVEVLACQDKPTVFLIFNDLTLIKKQADVKKKADL